MTHARAPFSTSLLAFSFEHFYKSLLQCRAEMSPEASRVVGLAPDVATSGGGALGEADGGKIGGQGGVGAPFNPVTGSRAAGGNLGAGECFSRACLGDRTLSWSPFCLLAMVTWSVSTTCFCCHDILPQLRPKEPQTGVYARDL